MLGRGVCGLRSGLGYAIRCKFKITVGCTVRNRIRCTVRPAMTSRFRVRIMVRTTVVRCTVRPTIVSRFRIRVRARPTVNLMIMSRFIAVLRP